MRTGDTSSRGPLLCREGTDCACSWYTWSALQKWLRGQLSALDWKEGKGHHMRREAPLELRREQGMSLHLPHTTRAPPHSGWGFRGRGVLCFPSPLTTKPRYSQELRINAQRHWRQTSRPGWDSQPGGQGERGQGAGDQLPFSRRPCTTRS